VWTKTQLRSFGGMGYDHLLRRIVPELQRRGVSAADVRTMLVENPARLLDRP
jgi:phosphotriesterase-related protein